MPIPTLLLKESTSKVLVSTLKSDERVVVAETVRVVPIPTVPEVERDSKEALPEIVGEDIVGEEMLGLEIAGLFGNILIL